MSNDLPTDPSSGATTIIGVPFDRNSSYVRGTALAPPRIREALLGPVSNVWTETGISILQDGVFCDAGDLDLESAGEPFAAIEEAVGDALDKGLVPICLGGDHSITYPIIKAFRKRYRQLGLLQIDAHPDLYDEFDGNRISHACPFARIMEEGLVDRLVQVGIRAMTGHQTEQAAKFGVEVIEMRDHSDSLSFSFDSPVYISCDLDGLDPAFAPGVSHPEPGGLSTRQVLSLIQTLHGQLVGADIVELNPARDPSGITAMVAAKILKELIAKSRQA